jgi:hypothetical protein
MKSKQQRQLYYSTELPNVTDRVAANFMLSAFIHVAVSIPEQHTSAIAIKLAIFDGNTNLTLWM